MLASIDAKAFVRVKEVREPDALAVKKAAEVLPDGRVAIDGEVLPAVTVTIVSELKVKAHEASILDSAEDVF